MLAFGTQPPQCEEAQTSPGGETSQKGPRGEELRCSAYNQRPPPDVCVNKQIPKDSSLSF